MKPKQFILVFIFIALSCTTAKTFPVSDLVPAAEITVFQKNNKDDNNEIKVEANYLASPDRVSKNASVYVVWLKSEEHGVKNIGALYHKNGKKSELKTVTSFVGTEIFITAEKEAETSLPEGTEISRVKL